MIERKNLEEQDIIELARENEQLKYQLQIIHANLIRVEKEIVKEYCLKGASSSEGIVFINDNKEGGWNGK